MKARIEPKFANRGVDVYLYDDAGPGQLTQYIWGMSGWQGEKVTEGTWPAPSLSMPMDMLEALVRESAGHVHAQDATVRHLDDATGTRDRLLSLIEKRGLR